MTSDAPISRTFFISYIISSFYISYHHFTHIFVTYHMSYITYNISYILYHIISYTIYHIISYHIIYYISYHISYIISYYIILYYIIYHQFTHIFHFIYHIITSHTFSISLLWGPSDSLDIIWPLPCMNFHELVNEKKT